MKNMAPGTIRQLIRDANTTPAALARDIRKSPTAFYLVIDGKRVSRDIMTHISAAIDVPVEEIWPETFLNGGPRRPGRPETRGLFDQDAA